MVEKYIEAINAGKIISVNWRSIEEMLGENAGRTVFRKILCKRYSTKSSIEL